MSIEKQSPKARVIRELLTRAITFNNKRLVVFLTPGYELRAGGVIAIADMYRQSIALRRIHRARVALCSVPGDDPRFLKYTWFKNRNYILNLESVLRGSGRLDYLLMHIPAYAVDRVLDWLTSASQELLSKVQDVHLNILLMNIDAIQGKNVSGLKRFGRVTCTTAHEAYSNLRTREILGVPLHRLGTYYGPELFSPSDYRDKESILVVSHDRHPRKEEVLEKIAASLPALRIQIVRNLHFDDYKDLTRRAKWSLTFGEGMDGYFADHLLSGGVSFAVFNDRFFTPPFANLETVYPSWEVLIDRMPVDIQRLDEPVAFTECCRQACDLMKDLGGTERFLRLLRLFYRGEYTFP